MASLYLHIPFCEKKCLYCDFYSIENSSIIEDFLTALREEIRLSSSRGRGTRFGTVYFGGGTPSLLSPRQLGDVLGALRESFSIVEDAEVTVEVNPGTVSPDKLRAYRALGFNRLSIGVQSFDAAELRFLERIHDRAEAIRCVEDARAAGFVNLSLDLIYALPGQSPGRWHANLEEALRLRPDHISAYSLIVEDGTPLARLVARGEVTPAPVEDEARMYEITMETLESHGFEHYEISNYARPGFRSRHNSSYWSHDDYLGFGPSAHSFWMDKGARSGRRWSNIAHLQTYCARLALHVLPVCFEETVAARELLNERIFLGLRSDGVNLPALRMEYGIDLRESRRDIVDGLLDERCASLEGGLLRLTPKGFLLCDEIAGRMMV